MTKRRLTATVPNVWIKYKRQIIYLKFKLRSIRPKNYVVFKQRYVQIVVSRLTEAILCILIFHIKQQKPTVMLINGRLIVENRNRTLLFWCLFEQNNLTVTLFITIQKDKFEFSLQIPPKCRNEVLLFVRSVTRTYTISLSSIWKFIKIRIPSEDLVK